MSSDHNVTFWTFNYSFKIVDLLSLAVNIAKEPSSLIVNLFEIGQNYEQLVELRLIVIHRPPIIGVTTNNILI